MKYYSLEVAGLKRELPIVKVSEEISIASFVVLGDSELICACAECLAPKIPSADLLVTAEAKGIPLAQELSRILNMKKYIVVRKSIKPYMQNVLVRNVNSITTQKEQLLCLNGVDVEEIKGKNIILVDDVVSTGNSINELKLLVEQAGGNVVGKVAILVEGEERDDVVNLGMLPIFPNK